MKLIITYSINSCKFDFICIELVEKGNLEKAWKDESVLIELI